MTVRSAPLQDGQAVEDARAGRRVRRGRHVQWSVGLALLAFGAPAWVVGGRYTVEGWAIWLNRLAGWLGIPEQLAAPAGWALLGWVAALGLIYSRVEVAHRPWSRASGRWVLAAPLAWVAWVLVVGTDLGTTYEGLIAPPAAGADAWRIDLAASEGAAGVAAILLTFGPEWLILGAWKLLKG